MSRAFLFVVAMGGLLATSGQLEAQEASGDRSRGACPWKGDPPDLTSVVAAPDSMPRLLGPSPRIPRFALRDGYRGRVVLAVVVDTSGAAEPATATILSSTDHDLRDWACDFLKHLRFAPAVAEGRRVRAQVAVPFEFSATVIRRR